MSPGLRRYLYATAATTGAAIMVVEVLGARMLSPYIGTSHFVWTAQIAVTLAALACGYYAGGRLADRSWQLHRLYGAILGAAAYLALTVLMCAPVAYGCVDFNLAIGSLLASAILFFVPLGLLAMTGPFLVRVITSSVAGVGGNVGRLTCISTLGSLAGTLLIGYVLIPRLPNTVTMYGTALALMLVGAIYFAVFRRGAGTTAAILALAAAAVGAVPLRQGLHPDYAIVTERFSGNSHFGRIQVLDRRDSPVRYLLNDNLIQNAYDTVQKQSTLAFTYLLTDLARAYTTNIGDVLVIGMGIGSEPAQFAARGARVDTVEINPAIVPLARRYFDFDPAVQRLTVGDGRHFLNRCRKQYDAVILDTFVGDACPTHLMTREAFGEARRRLRPGGALLVHSFGDTQAGRDFLLAAIKKTLRSEFRWVSIHATGEGAFVFVAQNVPAPAAIQPPDPAAVHPLARAEVAAAFAGTATAAVSDEGIVLTDDYNPADYYDAPNREALRRRLALAARRM